MHTALHDNDGNALYMAEYKAALVAGHSGDGETLDIVVIDGGYGFNSIRIINATFGTKSVFSRTLFKHFSSFS